MIDWDTTLNEFGYRSLPDSKRPKVVCICDNCSKKRAITIRVKSKVVNNQMQWCCPSCVKLRESNTISARMTKQWQDPEYISKRQLSSTTLWQDTEYQDKHSSAVKQAMKSVDMTSILKKRYGDPAEREKHRKISLELFSTPEFVDKHLQSMACPEVRAKCSAGAKAAWKDPSYREKMAQILSESSEKLWADPEYRERMSKIIGENSKKLWADPEYRERISKIFSESSKRRWADPEYREQISKILSESFKKLWADPEYRERTSKILSENSKQSWQNPDYRERMIAIYNQPEYRERISQIMIGLWTDPEFKERMSKILSENSKRRWVDPEYREKMAIVRANTPRTSSIQLQLYKYLDDLDIEYYKEGTETAIGYYAFDCLIPKQGKMHKHLLIECQGDYWHSLPKSIRNDKSKFTYIDRYFPEYEIIYIWEHEFHAKDRVLDRLKLKLGLDLECVDFDFEDVILKEVSSGDVREFLDAYHYIGKGRGGKCFGAYCRDELIGCIVFSSPLRQNTAGQFGLVDGDVRELSRLCIHPSYHKKNFASWFISRTIKLIDCRLVIAYADQTVGHDGTVYKASNFELHHTVPSDYWYVDSDGFVMHKKTLYQRARSLHMIESEFARTKGYVKRYGGEKLCFTRKINAS